MTLRTIWSSATTIEIVAALAVPVLLAVVFALVWRLSRHD